MTINPPLPVMEPAHFLSGVTSCMPCQTNCFAQPIRCQLSHLQLMPIFSRLVQQNSTSYSSLRVTKSHPTLPYYLLILCAGFVKVLYMKSFLLLKNLRNCLYFLQSYELLIVFCLHFESIGNCEEDMAEKRWGLYWGDSFYQASYHACALSYFWPYFYY